jgi:hypothetical protein
MATEPAEPSTPEEWQDAVDAAHALLSFESARLYGFIAGGPGVNVERCETILDQGRKLGYTPGPHAIEEFVQELAA